MSNLKIELLPSNFVYENGTFAKKQALLLAGKIAGVCYDKEGFKHLENEPQEKTERRINRTLTSGHHSVYDHISLSLNVQNIPKILAMIINNEHQYTTSEKSARYTPLDYQKDSIITEQEIELYHKWLEIFKMKIKSKYGDTLKDDKIKKLAQENARYLVTSFMPTQMIYTTTLRQINYLASWMLDYIATHKSSLNNFEIKLINSMADFIKELECLNILVPELMTNEKHRDISLFGNNLESKQDYFGEVYFTTYKTTFAGLAQAQRHRTLYYQMELLDEKEYYIPPILEDDLLLVQEWLKDIKSVKNINPQGELLLVSESGNYDNFILKCQERLCSAAQLEIMEQTRNTLFKYQEALQKNNSSLAQDIEKYTHGARCTFPNYECPNPCHFSEGIKLTRKI